MRQRSKTSKYARRLRHPDYMAFIRWCDCVLKEIAGAGECWGRTEADHAGDRPLSQKADDRTCIPACRMHHRDRTDYRGFYKGWGATKMRRFCDLKIHFYQNLYTNLVKLRQTPWRRKA